MSLSVSEQCRSGLATLRQIILLLSQSDQNDGHIKYVQINEELDRFSLFVGNIGALHQPQSSMSIESRLDKVSDVLVHIRGLLTDLNEVAEELLEIISGRREGMVAVTSECKEEDHKEVNEVDELREEISGTITRLFRASILIRQAASTDLFAKALSRNRYHFNDQFDIAHVSEKYCKLATDDSAWLRRRLGRAITQRRRYLSYIRDHQKILEGTVLDNTNSFTASPQAPAIKQLLPSRSMLETSSNYSFLTKATTIAPARITPQLLAAGDSEPEDDALSYTTISRSVDGERDSLTTVRIPKLDDLRVNNKEFQCPFCLRYKKFNNERTWRKHVFSDLRSYVCTFPDCDAPYFGDINEWFKHEMIVHRVTYKCFLCQNASFYRESNYLSHLRREHAGILRNKKERLEINLARKPLAQIPASDCPCCSEWVDRLRARMIQTNEPETDNILAVTPTVFKRHLASHLEQLALFAIPIGAAVNNDKSSNAAIEEENSKRSKISQLPTLHFESSRGDPVDARLDSETDNSEDHGSRAYDQITGIEETLRSMGNLEGRWDEVEELEVRLIEMRKRMFGNEHPDTLNSMANLARKQGRLREAEELEVQVMEMSKRVLGNEHPDTLTSMANLAATYWSQGRWHEAEELGVQVLEMRKRVLGNEHPDTLNSMANLAVTYRNQERLREAEELEVQVIEISKRVLGNEHPDTLTSMANLAATYWSQGRWHEAEELGVQVLEMRKRVLGIEHPAMLDSIANLAVIYRDQGRLREAEELEVQAIEIRKRVLGNE